MLSNTVCFPVIGYVRSPLSQKFGIPRQPNLVDVSSKIEMLPPFNTPLAFEGLADFSHIWVIWQFHQNRGIQTQSSPAHMTQPSFRPQVRPPRLGGNKKIGVFATRSMYRPANIGLSVVKLDTIAVCDNGVTLHIRGGDMVDGTPVIDIKPYIHYSDSITTANSGFAEQKPFIKKVIIGEKVQQKIAQQELSIEATDIDIITKLLAQDPRPAYRQQEFETQFMMRYANHDVVFFQLNNESLVWHDIIVID